MKNVIQILLVYYRQERNYNVYAQNVVIITCDIICHIMTLLASNRIIDYSHSFILNE